MKLKQFLTENNLSAAEFGRRIGVRSRMTICRYLSGGRMPDREVMQRIVTATGGKVQPNDFFDIPTANAASVEAAA